MLPDQLNARHERRKDDPVALEHAARANERALFVGGRRRRQVLVLALHLKKREHEQHAEQAALPRLGKKQERNPKQPGEEADER